MIQNTSAFSQDGVTGTLRCSWVRLRLEEKRSSEPQARRTGHEGKYDFGFGCHAETIAVAVAEATERCAAWERFPTQGVDPQAGEEAWRGGAFAAAMRLVRRLRTLLAVEQLGYSARWWRRRWFRSRPGTGEDRPADAEKLARNHRSGDLTACGFRTQAQKRCAIWCGPGSAKQDQLRARHRLSKFCCEPVNVLGLGLRHGRSATWCGCANSVMHSRRNGTLLDYWHEVEHMGERVPSGAAITEAVKLASPQMQTVVRICKPCAHRRDLGGNHRIRVRAISRFESARS